MMEDEEHVRIPAKGLRVATQAQFVRLGRILEPAADEHTVTDGVECSLERYREAIERLSRGLTSHRAGSRYRTKGSIMVSSTTSGVSELDR